jgi:hypothetical protein
MSLSKYLASLMVSIVLAHTPVLYAVVPLTELHYFASCDTPSYIYLSPAMGALCQEYAKNVRLLGNQSSETGIFLHELYEVQPDAALVDLTHKSTAIGRYLGSQDIGTLIGIVVSYKQKKYDERTTIKKINELFKKVVARNQSLIKDAIIHDLHSAIGRDNEQYLELEKKLLSLASPKDHPDLEHALKDVARTCNAATETALVHAFTTKEQRAIWQKMKKLHESLQRNRELLDTEKRTCNVVSPMLKDSMGALAHALIGSVAEEGSVYVPNNTLYLLLAFLWTKADSKNELRDAYNALAEVLALEPDALYTMHTDKPYTTGDYHALQKKTPQDIAQLPIEDIVFARLGHTLDTSEPSQHAAAYYQSLLDQYKNAHDQQKAVLEILIAAWARTEADVSMCEPRVQYCRFLMQPANTVPERITLISTLCKSKDVQPMMINAYLDAIINIYRSMPTTCSAQQQFFDSIVTCLLNTPPSSPLIAKLKQFCTQWVQHAENDATKTAILSVFFAHNLLSTNTIEGFKPFDNAQAAIAYASTIRSDSCNAQLILCIMTSDIKEKEYFEWATAALDALQDDTNKASLVIAALTNTAITPLTMQSIALRTVIITKILPSIRADAAVTAIRNHLARTAPSNEQQLQPLYCSAYDWLAQQVPTLRDDEHIITLVQGLLDMLDANAIQDQVVRKSIYSTLEKGVNLVHTEKKKLFVMQMILERPIDSNNPHIALYKTLYQWIEEQCASISDANKREELLRELLSANKKLY